MEPFNFKTLSERVTDEASAYRFLEELRWGDEPVCPHCASIGQHYFLNAQGAGRKTRTGKVSHRRVWACRDCRKQFSVLTGTVMHGTKVEVKTWVSVIYEMCASKNGVSSRELERKYGLKPKTAWFLCHRIREAMKRDPIVTPFTGTVIADETWFGGDPKNRHFKDRPHKSGLSDKTPIVSLVSEDTGEVRSRVVPNVRGDTLGTVIRQETDIRRTTLHTDESDGYKRVARDAAAHKSVNHGRYEYARDGVTTNRVEGYFAQLKRSIDGTHHAVSVEHLDRYLAEFDYRYSTRTLTDSQRMARLMGQVGGRRLAYKKPRN
jgi:transposase-like protein